MILSFIPGTVNLSGNFTYNNIYHTGMNGVQILLKNSSDVVIATTTTGPDASNSNQPGHYSFTNVPDGIYHLSASYSGDWGGNNATDALVIELYTVGLYPLYGLNLKVGDVTNNLIENATDALWVKFRTIGMINSYPAGDWMMIDTTFTLAGVANINLMGMCEGDVNGSYIPTDTKEATFLSVKDDGIISIPENMEFDYPVRSNIVADLGAMTLFLGYDADKFEVENASTPMEGLKYVIRDGEIRLAWSNVTPISVHENDPFITLRMKVKTTLNTPVQVFDVKSGSEFANEKAVRYDDFKLNMASIKTIGNSTGFSICNYPNPFSISTEIVYTLPEEGHVNLVLTNLLGEDLHTLVNTSQSAGSYTIKINPADFNMVPGVYIYKIKVEGTNSTFVRFNKMIFTR
jgi:hypothetical protein